VFFEKQDILSGQFDNFPVRTPINAGIFIVFGFFKQNKLGTVIARL
jgi:hypothetical protein